MPDQIQDKDHLFSDLNQFLLETECTGVQKVCINDYAEMAYELGRQEILKEQLEERAIAISDMLLEKKLYNIELER